MPPILTSTALVNDIEKWRAQGEHIHVKTEDNFESEWSEAPKHPTGFCFFVTEANRAGDTTEHVNPDRYNSRSIYKVLSVILSGTDDHYILIREKVQDLIKKNLDLFEALNSKTLVQVISEDGSISEKTKQEISAIASLIKCPIGISFKKRTLLFYPTVISPSQFRVAPLGAVIIMKLDEHLRFQWINQTLRKLPSTNQEASSQPSRTQQEALADLMALHRNEMPDIDFLDDEDLVIKLSDDQAKAFDYAQTASQPMKHAVVTTKDHNLRNPKRGKDTQKVTRPQARPRSSLPLFEPMPSNITTAMMKSAQFKDRLCVFLRELLLGKPFSFNVSEKDLKHYKERIHLFSVDDDGLLVYRDPGRELRYKILPPKDRIVLPLSAIKHVLCNVHDIHTVCAGIKGTQQFVATRFWRGKIGETPALAQMVKAYVQSCITCPLKSVTGNAHDPTLLSIEDATSPWQTFSCDVFSGLATATTGEKKIVVFMDLFSRFMIAEPIKNETSREILDALVKRVIGPYGFFTSLKSDNDMALQSLEFNDTCRRFDIKRIRFLPFCPSSNGLIERSMSTLSRAFRVISQKDSDWPISLPIIVHGYNTTLQTTLGDSPHFCAFGRDAITVADLVVSDVEIRNRYALGTSSPWEYGCEMQLRMKNVRELFLEQIRNHSALIIQRNNKKRTEKIVKPGQLVLVLYPLRETDKIKQTSRYVGLFRVMEVHGYKVIIAPQGGKARFNVHVRRVTVIPRHFYEGYVNWQHADAENLLSDPELNMTDLDKDELEELPPFDNLKVSKRAQHNRTHLINDCP